VLENVMVGRHVRTSANALAAVLRTPHARREEAAIRARSLELLDYVGIGRYADLVGRERVIAGVDCGFGTAVREQPMVADSIVWAKLKSLSEGAAIASQRLWGAKAA